MVTASGRPEVSVIIPVRNGEAFVAEAVRSALDQTGVVTEVVVVNDGSTDRTGAILAAIDSPALRVIELERSGGGAAARNLAVAQARAELIAFLDADDLFLPRKLAQQLWRLPPDADQPLLVATGYCDHRGVAVSPTGYGRCAVDTRSVLIKEADVPTSGWLLRREHFQAIGGFDTRFPRHQDIEFLVRFLRRGRVAVVDRPLFMKRQFARPRAADVERALATYATQFQREIAALSPRDRRALAARSHTRVATLRLVERRPHAALAPLARAAVTAPWRTAGWLARPLRRRSPAPAQPETGRLRIVACHGRLASSGDDLGAWLAGLDVERTDEAFWRIGQPGDVLHLAGIDPAASGRLFLARLRGFRRRGGSVAWSVPAAQAADCAAGAGFWPRFHRQLDGLLFPAEASRRLFWSRFPDLRPLPSTVLPCGPDGARGLVEFFARLAGR